MATMAIITMNINPKSLRRRHSPVINGDGTYSRDFTYIDNVVQMNQLAAISDNPDAINQVYNTACGGRVDLNEMTCVLKQELAKFDPSIGDVEIVNGPERMGDPSPFKTSLHRTCLSDVALAKAGPLFIEYFQGNGAGFQKRD